MFLAAHPHAPLTCATATSSGVCVYREVCRGHEDPTCPICEPTTHHPFPRGTTATSGSAAAPQDLLSFSMSASTSPYMYVCVPAPVERQLTSAATSSSALPAGSDEVLLWIGFDYHEEHRTEWWRVVRGGGNRSGGGGEEGNNTTNTTTTTSPSHRAAGATTVDHRSSPAVDRESGASAASFPAITAAAWDHSPLVQQQQQQQQRNSNLAVGTATGDVILLDLLLLDPRKAATHSTTTTTAAPPHTHQHSSHHYHHHHSNSGGVLSAAAVHTIPIRHLLRSCQTHHDCHVPGRVVTMEWTTTNPAAAAAAGFSSTLPQLAVGYQWTSFHHLYGSTIFHVSPHAGPHHTAPTICLGTLGMGGSGPGGEDASFTMTLRRNTAMTTLDSDEDADTVPSHPQPQQTPPYRRHRRCFSSSSAFVSPQYSPSPSAAAAAVPPGVPFTSAPPSTVHHYYPSSQLPQLCYAEQLACHRLLPFVATAGRAHPRLLVVQLWNLFAPQTPVGQVFLRPPAGKDSIRCSSLRWSASSSAAGGDRDNGCLHCCTSYGVWSLFRYPWKGTMGAAQAGWGDTLSHRSSLGSTVMMGRGAAAAGAFPSASPYASPLREAGECFGGTSISEDDRHHHHHDEEGEVDSDDEDSDEEGEDDDEVEDEMRAQRLHPAVKQQLWRWRQQAMPDDAEECTLVKTSAADVRVVEPPLLSGEDYGDDSGVTASAAAAESRGRGRRGGGVEGWSVSPSAAIAAQPQPYAVPGATSSSSPLLTPASPPAAPAASPSNRHHHHRSGGGMGLTSAAAAGQQQWLQYRRHADPNVPSKSRGAAGGGSGGDDLLDYLPPPSPVVRGVGRHHPLLVLLVLEASTGDLLLDVSFNSHAALCAADTRGSALFWACGASVSLLPVPPLIIAAAAGGAGGADVMRQLGETVRSSSSLMFPTTSFFSPPAIPISAGYAASMLSREEHSPFPYEVLTRRLLRGTERESFAVFRFGVVVLQTLYHRLLDSAWEAAWVDAAAARAGASGGGAAADSEAGGGVSSGGTKAGSSSNLHHLLPVPGSLEAEVFLKVTTKAMEALQLPAGESLPRMLSWLHHDIGGASGQEGGHHNPASLSGDSSAPQPGAPPTAMGASTLPPPPPQLSFAALAVRAASVWRGLVPTTIALLLALEDRQTTTTATPAPAATAAAAASTTSSSTPAPPSSSSRSQSTITWELMLSAMGWVPTPIEAQWLRSTRSFETHNNHNNSSCSSMAAGGVGYVGGVTPPPFKTTAALQSGEESLSPLHLCMGDRVGMSDWREALERRATILVILGDCSGAASLLMPFASLHPVYSSLAMLLSVPPPPPTSSSSGSNACKNGPAGVLLPIPHSTTPISWEGGCSLWLTLLTELINLTYSTPITQLAPEARRRIVWCTLHRYRRWMAISDQIGLATAVLLTPAATPALDWENLCLLQLLLCEMADMEPPPQMAALQQQQQQQQQRRRGSVDSVLSPTMLMRGAGASGTASIGDSTADPGSGMPRSPAPLGFGALELTAPLTHPLPYSYTTDDWLLVPASSTSSCTSPAASLLPLSRSFFSPGIRPLEVDWPSLLLNVLVHHSDSALQRYVDHTGDANTASCFTEAFHESTSSLSSRHHGGGGSGWGSADASSPPSGRGHHHHRGGGTSAVDYAVAYQQQLGSAGHYVERSQYASRCHHLKALRHSPPAPLIFLHLASCSTPLLPVANGAGWMVDVAASCGANARPGAGGLQLLNSATSTTTSASTRSNFWMPNASAASSAAAGGGNATSNPTAAPGSSVNTTTMSATADRKGKKSSENIHPLCALCGTRVIGDDSSSVPHEAVTPERSFLWCTLCLHGGHWDHVESWLNKHRLCPVEGCVCRCMD